MKPAALLPLAAATSALPKWEMMHLVLAVFGVEALDRQEQLINRTGFGHAIIDEKDSGHRFTRPNSVISEAGYGVSVMREQNPSLSRGPGEDNGVGRCRQADILNAHRIQVRRAAQEPAEDISVEVFVNGQFDHRATSSPWRGP